MGKPCPEWDGPMTIIAKIDVIRAVNGCGSRSVLTEDEWLSIVASLRLSDREFQIVQCIFDGDKETTIANSLDLSPHTVHTYIERLYRKLGVASRCELLIRIFGEHLTLNPIRAQAGEVTADKGR